MSGKTSSTSTWLKFFRGAGIPTGIDTKYALLFDENRIKMDMLMDLDKEILKDVGIVAMGDIISILKHARKVHDETKEQAVETNKPTQSQSQSPIPSGVSGKAALESSVQPAFKVVSKVCVPVSSKPESKSTPGEATVKAKTASLLQQSIRMMERATQGKSLPTETVQKAVTQPAEIAERKMIVLNKRSSAESPLREEVPLQKKIRVLPEHEGKYKIKMPDGLIPRTQKVIQSRLGPSVSELASAKDKKNVFERLGESSVSSSTEDKQPLSSSTSSSSTRIESSNDNFSKLSVFERLGDRGRQGGSPKTPITLSSTVTKPLIQTKVYLPPHQTQTAAPPPKSRYDPKVYTEKTLTTIPSRISIPYLNKARVKSEIIAPSASSSTTTTRVISAKTSATSTTSQSQRESSFRPATEPLTRPLPTKSYAEDSHQNQRVRFRGISDIEASLHDAPRSSSSASSYSKASSSQDKWRDVDKSSSPVDGQVLQTIRMPSKNKGKVIVKRLIYKKIPKSAAATSNFDLDLPDDIEDPLAEYYQDDED